MPSVGSLWTSFFDSLIWIILVVREVGLRLRNSLIVSTPAASRRSEYSEPIPFTRMRSARFTQMRICFSSSLVDPASSFRPRLVAARLRRASVVRTFDLRNLVADLGSSPAMASIVAIPLPSVVPMRPAADRPPISLASELIASPSEPAGDQQWQSAINSQHSAKAYRLTRPRTANRTPQTTNAAVDRRRRRPCRRRVGAAARIGPHLPSRDGPPGGYDLPGRPPGSSTATRVDVRPAQDGRVRSGISERWPWPRSTGGARARRQPPRDRSRAGPPSR